MQTTTDGKIKLGKDLNVKELQALQKASLTGTEILDNMDDLNFEIAETTGSELPRAEAPRTINKKVKKETVMTLEQELEEMNKKLDAKIKAEKAMRMEKEEEESEEVQEQVQESKGDSIKDQVIGLLKKSAGAPKDSQIAQWKAQHGQNGVYAIGMGEGDVYVFTHLKRGQWKKIQQIMSKMQTSDESFDAEDEMKKKVVQYCVLWPQPLPLEFFYNSRAGVLDAIYQSILLNSYFLSPQQTMMLTTQL